MTSRRFSIPGAVFLLFGAAYFLVPLAATMEFSFRDGFSAYSTIFGDPQFRDTLWLSFRLALETIAISLVLFVPTVYWIHLRLPRVRRLVEFLSLLPFVIPPIVLVVGLLDVYRPAPQFFVGTPQILVAGYVVLSFPYLFRALDAGFQAIDVHTLTEASRNLGAGWLRTLVTVILPNVKVAALSGAFLTLAIVMGEFTMANVLLFNTFPVYMTYVGARTVEPAAALAIISFGITWLAMLGILLIGRRIGGRGQVQVGGTR